MLNLQTLKHRRENRGVEIIANNVEIKQVDESTYLAPSQTEKGKFYQVVNVGGVWEYECPDFYWRGLICKHIHAINISNCNVDRPKIRRINPYSTCPCSRRSCFLS